MSRRLLSLLAGVLLAGCTVAEPIPPTPTAPAGPSVKAAIETVTAPPAPTPTTPAPGEVKAAVSEAKGLVSPFKALSDILDKIANNRLLTAINQDADRTLALIDAWQTQNPPALTPLLEFQARACPTAAKLASADLKEKIDMLKSALGLVDTELAGFDPTQPAIIYFFTKLRYGPAGVGIAGLDPKAAIAQLKADVAGRVTAVMDSCRQIVPLKQIDELNQLLLKGGLIAGTGGAAGPLLGILP